MNKIYLVDADYVNSRLDKWFKRKVSEVPQSLIEKNLRKGNIKINDRKAKSSYKLQKDDKITLYNIEFTQKINTKSNNFYKPNKKDLSFSSQIFIENNDNFAVINKPSGIAVQSGTKSRRNILDILRKCKEFEGNTPFTVHRIDKETTGILIVAKNRKFAQLFTSLFRIRKIHKTYLCICVGTLNKKNGTLQDDLFHYEGNKKIITKAITHFEVLNTTNNYSLLKLNPETGRKHQLRKQLLIHGCPVLGDRKYRLAKNYNNKGTLMLHAYKIKFSIAGKKYSFTAELPLLFRKTINEKYLKTSL